MLFCATAVLYVWGALPWMSALLNRCLWMGGGDVCVPVPLSCVQQVRPALCPAACPAASPMSHCSRKGKARLHHSPCIKNECWEERGLLGGAKAGQEACRVHRSLYIRVDVAGGGSPLHSLSLT